MLLTLRHGLITHHMAFVALAGISGFLAVLLGAWGAHSLKPMLSEKAFSVFKTASEYHFWHTLALLATALLRFQNPHKLFTAAACAFVLGLLLFCGSLYAVAFGIPKAGTIAPVGGLTLSAGWLFLALGAARRQ